RLMMALLSDHSDGASPEEPFRTAIEHRGGICIHANDDGSGGNTAASLVADLCAGGSRLPVYWCSFYSPCPGALFPVFRRGTLPPVLAVGDETPSDDSPWWLFHRLAGLARTEPARVPAIRERWATFQEQLFATAYPLAREAQKQIAAGQ